MPFAEVENTQSTAMEKEIPCGVCSISDVCESRTERTQVNKVGGPTTHLLGSYPLVGPWCLCVSFSQENRILTHSF